MINLLKETLACLEDNHKTQSDVRWVGNGTHKATWQEFKKLADTEYDDGYGLAEVASDLMVVGEDWWLDRREYDGPEWWAYNEHPKEPKNVIDLKALTIRQIGSGLYRDSGLLGINGFKGDDDNI